MKYKLLKDLPYAKAGTIFNEDIKSDGTRVLEQYRYTIPTMDIDNFDEWFEQTKEEPTASVRRTPKIGEPYFYVDEYGNVEREIWDNDGVDNELIAMGFVRLTPEEATEARDRRLAEVRLRQTSDFEPDFAKGKGGWVVCYDYLNKNVDCFDSIWNDSGEPVRYATKEDAKKSIKENEADWRKYLGIKEKD